MADCPWGDNPDLSQPCPRGWLCLGPNAWERLDSAVHAPAGKGDAMQEFLEYAKVTESDLVQAQIDLATDPSGGAVTFLKWLMGRSIDRILVIFGYFGHPDVCAVGASAPSPGKSVAAALRLPV